ncbi:MAG TPA: hypothetical protein VFF06_31385 [Polyangia bacterium]|nr:hypothetical protein [Polyangia bacterium]
MALALAVAFTAVALTAAAPRAARAEETHCRGIQWSFPALERADAGKRLRFIRDSLTRDASRMRIWREAWIGIYGAVTVANGIGLALSNNTTDYIDWGLGVGSSAVGLITVLIPRKVLHDSRWLSRRIGDAPPGTDVCELVAEAERVLIADAHDEAFTTSPLAHAGSFLFNLGIAVSLIAIGHLDEALMHGFVGLVVGEVQIDTMPTGAVKALRNYRLGLLDGAPKPPPVAWSILPSAAQGRYTINFALAF